MEVRIVGVVAALLAGCVLDDGGEPAAELANGGQAIVNGAASTAHPAVVALTVRGGGAFCTGTLVSRRVVVTAAHCLPPHVPVSIDQIEIFFGDRIDEPGVRVGVVEAVAHAGWKPELVPHDIGVLALSADAPVAPVHMVSSGADARSGVEVRLVGFGKTVAGGADSGVKREGSATISRVDPSTIYLGAGAALTCNGDSGGPMFLERDGATVLAGVHSRSDCETVSLNQRLDVELSTFVHPFVARHEGLECGADAVCNEDCTIDPDCGEVGEPALPMGEVESGCAAAGGGSAGWLAAGLAALLASRRRRPGVTQSAR
jgi:MYXO-CTERM domain-containing protein